MAVIGMGKQVGAEICHKKGWKYMANNIERIGSQIFERADILFGVGLVENAYEETCKIAVLPKNEILACEPELLVLAKRLMPTICFPKFDVLVVDRIGKNISGDGMDPNITGTYFTPYASGGPEKENVVVLDLTKQSHGSAIGIGAASVTTQRFFDKMDREKTYPNCLTSKVLEVCKVPLVAPSDKTALAAAIYACALADQENLEIVRIKDTLHTQEIYISEALYNRLHEVSGVEVVEPPVEMVFNELGNLF